MIKVAKMREGFWGEALNHAVFLHNRTVTRTLQKLTANEPLLGFIPDNSRIKIFGCAAYDNLYMVTR